MTERTDADLTPAEIKRICHPLKQKAAMIRFLRRQGLIVRESAGGEPLVNRQHYNEVGCGRALVPGEGAAHGPAANETPAEPGANIVGLDAWAARRKHGKTARQR